MKSSEAWLLDICVIVLVAVFAITPVILRRHQNYIKHNKIAAVARHYRVSQWMDFSPDSTGTADISPIEFIRPYIIPMIVLMLVMYACSAVAFFITMSELESDPVMFLTGGRVFIDDTEGKAYVAGTCIAIVAAFFGNFVWSASYIYRRLASYDLAPITYYQVTLRLLSAAMVAVVMRHVLSLELFDAGTELIVLAAFVAGLDPSLGINWLRRLANKHVFKEEQETDKTISVIGKMPVKVIDGLSPYILVRLEEFEIDDVQNLASTNPILLYARTPFGLAQVTDWVAQAQFFQLFGRDKIATLKAVGIRNVLQFHAQCQANPDFIRARLSEGETIPVTESYVKSLAATLDTDPSFNLLRCLNLEIIKRREWRVP